MTTPFAIQTKADRLTARRSADNAPLLEIQPIEWESEFFKRSFGRLSFDPTCIRKLEEHEWHALMRSATDFADMRGYRILELELNINDFDLIPLCEDVGFRLVDSQISFFTRIEKAGLQQFKIKTGRIDTAQSADLEAIISLTQSAFVDNPHFHSRFKNPRYFTNTESKAYYTAWITNHFSHPDTLFAAWRDRARCVGYYFYQRRGVHAELPVFKGMLTAADRRYQNQKGHLAMQSYLFDQIENPAFYIDNTTQLANFAVIKNHVTANRKLSAMRMVFYRELQQYSP